MLSLFVDKGRRKEVEQKLFVKKLLFQDRSLSIPEKERERKKGGRIRKGDDGTSWTKNVSNSSHKSTQKRSQKCEPHPFCVPSLGLTVLGALLLRVSLSLVSRDGQILVQKSF